VKHVISALVQNRPGVLANISGLFSSRGYNIQSLAVGETEDPKLSRMTIVAEGDDAVIEQIRKQLQNVIEVIKVQDFTGTDYVERDLMLIRVSAPSGKRGEIMEIVDIFRAKIADVGANDLIIEVSGTEDKLEAMVKLLRRYGIKELVRTGRIAMLRGAK